MRFGKLKLTFYKRLHRGNLYELNVFFSLQALSPRLNAY